MPFYVYVLESESSDRLYTGHTKNIDERVNQHNSGKSRYTRGRGPWRLMFYEEYATRGEAMVREKFLKTGRGRDWIKSKLAGRTQS